MSKIYRSNFILVVKLLEQYYYIVKYYENIRINIKLINIIINIKILLLKLQILNIH